jgi:acetamidase/formamidase
MAIHYLPANNDTVTVGYFDCTLPPALTVESGDIVTIETLHHYGGTVQPGMSLEEIACLRGDPQWGPHSVTGPVAIRGAKPGDGLEVRILKIVLKSFGFNSSQPGKGALPDDCLNGQIKYFDLEAVDRAVRFAPGIAIPLRPFPGIVAVAPAVEGQFSTIQPGPFGGNLDLKELTEGAVLYLPVFAPEALLWIGDAHAAQGDGEVNHNAIECAFREIQIQLVLRKDLQIHLPLAETPTHWITLGFHPDLDEALKIALKEMIRFLEAEKGLSFPDAYALCSIAVDFRVTQAVNGNKGIHGMLPKVIFL